MGYRWGNRNALGTRKGLYF
ncbi:hypothetical protein CCACVL1_01834 [Corchorus capsularis]|uniref:Uncharacterized protein n=1 Tax=Corchorus capsularis TaxID=210143 RepID=A0A1R3KFA3_COCAP|nr:hypothetical protein CCACVL1_01834 [Corchorus capsularis]